MARDAAIEQLLMPIVYVQHLAREFSDHARLLEGSGLVPADLANAGKLITVKADLRCVSNALALAPTSDWYQHWALRIAEHYHGPLTTAWLNAPTLGRGLDAFVRYFPRRIPYMEIRAERRAERLAIEFRPLLGVGELLPLLVEVPLIIVQRYLATVRNQAMTEAAIELAYAAPAHAAAYAAVFECPVDFGRECNRLVLPAAWLELPNLAYDEAAWRMALERCAQWDRAHAPRDIMAAVRREIFAAIDRTRESDALPTLTAVAARLSMSPRTLIRRLREVDTTFSAELDDVRRTRARELMDGGMRVAQVAACLKYTDTTSFSKAFRRWFGVAPSRFRTGLRGPA
jgi:AraC-like DNA-binding protein